MGSGSLNTDVNACERLQIVRGLNSSYCGDEEVVQPARQVLGRLQFALDERFVNHNLGGDIGESAPLPSFYLVDCISVGVDRMQRNFEPMRKIRSQHLCRESMSAPALQAYSTAAMSRSFLSSVVGSGRKSRSYHIEHLPADQNPAGDIIFPQSHHNLWHAGR